MHLKRGFLDIGYHYVITRDGTLETGRPDNVSGAHARGYNHTSIGICMVGGVRQEIIPATTTHNKRSYKLHPENNFTPEQFETLDTLLTTLQLQHPCAVTLGHCDLPNVKKTCPNFDVAEWLVSYN